ncbi:putative knottin, scorpion toxin [Medicago truncatula]|uniref:Defensin-like protein n=1 Tax=Medicago truncatula TaxID=3880 RepID=A0A072TKJ2_MEDTR|nr:Defensin-like protein [Medicago truncatula]RHN38862.1 putative knottin, scorpion toxin [Medicago truncatula]
MAWKTLFVLCFFLIAALSSQEGVVKVEECEKPSALFSGVCVDKPANQQCDYLCRKGEKLLSGSCKNKKCVCVC